ncbi:MAG: anhydro-N-acetylmuramic acid kinase [Hymenobacter sp.]
MSQPAVHLEDLVLLNAELARRHAAAVLACLAEWRVGPAEVDVLASHGQTIWHAPRHQHSRADFPHHATLQIGDGDHLAQLTGIITLSDFSATTRGRRLRGRAAGPVCRRAAASQARR